MKKKVVSSHVTQICSFASWIQLYFGRIYFLNLLQLSFLCYYNKRGIGYVRDKNFISSHFPEKNQLQEGF